LALTLGCAARTPNVAEAKAVHVATPNLELKHPEYLPEEARDMLRARMGRHGEEMMVLVATVLLLNYEVAEELALDIAREPRLGRPGPHDKDSLNARLPKRFFELQDELVIRAQAVAAAARAHDDTQLIDAYGALAKTCVGCHAAYFRGDETGPGLE
jgi:hypothetical protein